MPVLHQGIDGVAGEGDGPRCPLRDEPAVGIGQRAMCRIAALLAPEVDRAVARILGSVRVPSILGAQPALVLLGIQGHFEGDEALVAGVRADQRAVGTHMPADEAFGQGALHRLVKQSLFSAAVVVVVVVVVDRQASLRPETSLRIA